MLNIPEDMYEDINPRLDVISDIIDELVEMYPERRERPILKNALNKS